jgi:hypothetical protein
MNLLPSWVFWLVLLASFDGWFACWKVGFVVGCLVVWLGLLAGWT